MSWEIQIGAGSRAVPSAYGVESLRVDHVSRGVDVATLVGDPALLAPLYGDAVQIWHGGVRRFVGAVRTSALGGTSERTVSADNAWGRLERLPYLQQWMFWDAETSALVPQYSARLVLGQDDDGDRISVADQIAAVVAYAASMGVGIQLGAVGVEMTLPIEETRGLTCAQAIERMLRFAPDAASWFDYSTTPPTLHIGYGDPIAQPASEDQVVSLRHDLVVPGLVIEIERGADMDGAPGRFLELLEAGDTEDPEAVRATLTLSGGSLEQSRVEIAVETEAIPDPLDNADWWIARHPRLKGIAAADLSFIQATRELTHADYPRRSLTPLESLQSVGKLAAVDKLAATVDIVKRDGDGVILTAEHAVELELEIVATNATTRTYGYLASASVSLPESVPAGLAAAILSHWSVLYAQGSAVWPLASLWPHPGRLLHETPVQSVSVDSASASATVVYGPPQQLGASDLAALLARFRTRRPSIRYEGRASGKAPASPLQRRDAVGPVKAAGHADGAPTRLRMVKGESSSARTIDLDPAKLSAGDVAEPRQIDIPSGAGTASRVKALATAPGSVASALALLVGTSGDGRTTVTEGSNVASLTDAIRVVDVSAGIRIALDISRLYLVDGSGNTVPLSYFFGTVGSTIGIKLDHVVSPDAAETGSLVALLPRREYDGNVYPKGAYLA